MNISKRKELINHCHDKKVTKSVAVSVGFCAKLVNTHKLEPIPPEHVLFVENCKGLQNSVVSGPHIQMTPA